MATLEREFSARWGVDEVFRYFRDGILAGSQSVTDGGGSVYETEGARFIVRVFERFSLTDWDLVSLSLLLAVTAAVMLFYNIKIKKHSRDELLVNQVAAEAAEGTAEADISTAEAGESVPAGQEEPELPQPPETQNGEGGETDGNTH